MRDLVQTSVFIVVFFGLVTFLLARRFRMKFSALLALALCLVYYLF